MSYKHGMTGTRIYYIWHHMKKRCRKKYDVHYDDYGGRGIDYCDEWEEFENFWEWAKNSGYKDNLQIDRIDNNKGYYPENCRWTTSYVQNRNRRDTREYTINGITLCLEDWCIAYKINRYTVLKRLECGWNIKDALERPPRILKEYTIKGIMKTLYSWTKIYHISHSTVRYRLAKGMSIDEALKTPINKK
jgi:hypothetical protein